MYSAHHDVTHNKEHGCIWKPNWTIIGSSKMSLTNQTNSTLQLIKEASSPVVLSEVNVIKLLQAKERDSKVGLLLLFYKSDNAAHPFGVSSFSSAPPRRQAGRWLFPKSINIRDSSLLWE